MTAPSAARHRTFRHRPPNPEAVPNRRAAVRDILRAGEVPSPRLSNAVILARPLALLSPPAKEASMADLHPDACASSETDVAAPLSVRMTVFSAAKPLVKNYALAEDGNLAEPMPGANLAAGTARHETLTGATAGDVLGQLARLPRFGSARKGGAP